MWFTLIRLELYFLAVNGNKNLISKKFMTKKNSIEKKILKHFQKHISKHIMT